jgi:UDP-N-acetylenolpyruvoylglucosamine reductase
VESLLKETRLPQPGPVTLINLTQTGQQKPVTAAGFKRSKENWVSPYQKHLGRITGLKRQIERNQIGSLFKNNVVTAD